MAPVSPTDSAPLAQSADGGQALPPLPQAPPKEDQEPKPVRSQFDASMRVYAIDNPVHWLPHDWPRELAPSAEIVTVRAAREREHERTRARAGRPSVVDEDMKYTMLELLGIGLSLRMTAAHVGVSHQTVANVLEKDPAFAEEVRRTRQNAKVYPLNCILRECGRSWRAAAWLMEFLERKERLERAGTEKHLESVREKALARIENDLAEKIRKQAAADGHPWVPKPTGEAPGDNPLGLLAGSQNFAVGTGGDGQTKETKGENAK